MKPILAPTMIPANDTDFPEEITVENVKKYLNSGLQKIFGQFRGEPLTDQTKHTFKTAVVNLLTEVSMALNERDATELVEVVVATDENNPTMILVSFEPRSPHLKNAKIVQHTPEAEGQAPIYAAYVGIDRARSGWGPTPFHALADLERNFGTKEN